MFSVMGSYGAPNCQRISITAEFFGGRNATLQWCHDRFSNVAGAEDEEDEARRGEDEKKRLTGMIGPK
jgi:hypothetical protein